MDYNNLANIAHARGDAAAAAGWEAKRDAKRAELRRLANEGAPPGAQVDWAGLRRWLLGAAGGVLRARKSGRPLDPASAEALA